MQRFHPLLSAVAAVAALSACAGSSEPVTRTLALTGTASVATFPFTATSVRATRAGQVVASAPIAADGTFALSIPAATRYRLEVVGTDGTAVKLVYPRVSGAIDASFDVTGAGQFALGNVRYIGDPRQQSFLYAKKASAPEASDGDGECKDGIDTATGAVCVDDDAESSADTCAPEEGKEGAETDGDNVECENGLDANGQACDGGPAANADDGTEAGSEEDVPTDAAVADHNLPGAIGCGDDEADGGVDCQDGLDPSGQPCDGGPDANKND